MPSLLEALERKYFSDFGESEKKAPEEEEEKAEEEDLSCHRQGKCVASVSIGEGEKEEKQRHISIFIPRLSPLVCVPEVLVLNDCDIDCAGAPDQLGDKCKRVRQLDLAQNKLHDWHEILQIVKHMPSIEFFNLSRNHLNGSLCKSCMVPIANLRSIVLNSTYLSWDSIQILLENLPLLEELHLSLNDYKEVLIDISGQNSNTTTAWSEQIDKDESSNELPEEEQEIINSKLPHKSLKTLHFTANPVTKWIEICRLGRVFPSLENLVLAKCPIESLSDDGEGSKQLTTPNSFPNLAFLNLSCTHLDNWEDVDRLAQFPKLNSLRVKHWPLWQRLECTEHERRQLLIARLPNVTILNGGGVISADEREDAERAFIRHYMDKPESERPARYDELVHKHGKLDPLVNVSLKPDKRINIILTYGDKSEKRLVGIYRTVADFKQKLAKVIGLPASKMRLFYVDQDYKEFGPEEMRYPNKLLYSYNIHSGDEIIIDEKK